MERITKFDVLTASEELWKAHFDHTEAIRHEIDPEDPQLPREKLRAMMLSAFSIPSDNKYIYLALTGEGEAAGFLSLSVENERSPSYQSNKHVGNMNISVLGKYRRKGLGRKLLRHAIDEMAAKEPAVTEFLAGVFLDSGRGFLDSLGGTVSLQQSANRLYLKDLDWAMVEAWAAEGARKNPATAVVQASVIPEADIKNFSGLYTETMNQQPLGDIGVKIVVTPEQIRLHEKHNRDNGVEQMTIYTRENDGTVSGLTETIYLEEAGHKVKQMLTGVRENCRGRGLGKLLKAQMLLHIRKELPGVKFVVTANSDSNAPMLAINNKLGFKKHLPLKVYKLKIK